MTELLAPVGNWIMLEAAIKAGADSVYLGVQGLNMRAAARNFSLEELEKVVKRAHKDKVRVYLTVNTIVYDDEIEKIKKVLKGAKKAKVDAIICWDLAVISEAKKLNLEIHLSTQASVSNFESLKLFYKLGVRRFVLAREISLDQIKEIKKKIKKEKLKVEIEVFIHGAMCVSVSGRCFMSQFSFGKSANRGGCWQPCRREYLVKDIEGGVEFKLGNNFVMSPKDLCTIEFIDKLVEAGIDVFKIEGRNRSPEYVKTVVSAYRKVIDNPKDKKIIKQQLKKLKTVYNKGFSSGFFLGKPINEWSGVEGSKATEKKVYVGKVLNYYSKVKVAEIILEASDLKIGDRIMFQGNKTGVVEEKVKSLEVDKKKVKKISKGKSVGIKIKGKVRENDQVYKMIRQP
ncbi:peptidase U32 family protein [Nanoarchaeota archaeon]